MSKKKDILNSLSIPSTLVLPIILFIWFAWQGFSGMAEADPMGWKWYAGLLGGISSIVMVGAGAFGLYLYFKRNFKINSKL